MKTSLKRIFATIVLSTVIGFVIYLIKGYFPTFEKWLNNVSHKIINYFHFSINPQLFSIFIALFILFLVYILISLLKFKVKQKIYSNYIDKEGKVETSKITRIIFSVIFIPLIFSYGSALIGLILNSNMNNQLIYFAIGFIIHVILWYILGLNSRKKDDIYSTFEHEFTHSVVGVLFFHKPTAFFASNSGGVTAFNERVNFVVKLAPYFLLTFCLFMLPIYYVLKPSIYIFYFIILGSVTSYHTLSTIKETSLKQPDIATTGKLFSIIVIILGSVINYGIILAFVLGRMPLLKNFLKQGVFSIYQLLQGI